MMLVAPTLNVTVEPGVRPESVQKVSVGFSNTQVRPVRYEVISAPPLSVGALQLARAVVLSSAARPSAVGGSGMVAGTPQAITVFEANS